MVRVGAASEQLDVSTIKGQWRKVYEIDLGARAVDLMWQGARRGPERNGNRFPHVRGPGG